MLKCCISGYSLVDIDNQEKMVLDKWLLFVTSKRICHMKRGNAVAKI